MLTCSTYRGMKLVKHAMKVLERITERRVRNIVRIDNIMQFGREEHNGCNFHISSSAREIEKYLARKKDLWMAFVDCEKAFDRFLREVVWCTQTSQKMFGCG